MHNEHEQREQEDDFTHYFNAVARANAEIAALKARVAALEAQLRWQPVEDGFEYADGGHRLYVNGGELEMNNDANEGDRWVLLPDGVRLCRFTPAADWVDWEKVPPGFDWVAADGDGKCWAFTSQPERNDAAKDAEIARLRRYIAERTRKYDALLSEWIEAHALMRALVRTAKPDGKFDKAKLAAAKKYLADEEKRRG